LDFTLTEEQHSVCEAARELFRAECPLDLVRRAWDAPGGATESLDRHLLGWLELGGGDLVDASLFVEQVGRAVAPGPFFASLLATQVARAAGIELERTASVAVSASDGIWNPHPDPVKHFVPCAREVDAIVVVSGSREAPRISVARAMELPAAEVEQMDRLRRQYRVDTAGVPVDVPIDPVAWRHAVERALVLCASELIGVARGLHERSIAHARERVQFGRPIGAFQGLQWMLVDSALELERAAAAVGYASMCIDADDADRSRAVHVAKAEAGLAARRCARTSTQIHGGIGYTWEHGLHYWLRRAYAGDAFMGPAAYHHDRLAELLFDA